MILFILGLVGRHSSWIKCWVETIALHGLHRTNEEGLLGTGLFRSVGTKKPQGRESLLLSDWDSLQWTSAWSGEESSAELPENLASNKDSTEGAHNPLRDRSFSSMSASGPGKRIWISIVLFVWPVWRLLTNITYTDTAVKGNLTLSYYNFRGEFRLLSADTVSYDSFPSRRT